MSRQSESESSVDASDPSLQIIKYCFDADLKSLEVDPKCIAQFRVFLESHSRSITISDSKLDFSDNSVICSFISSYVQSVFETFVAADDKQSDSKEKKMGKQNIALKSYLDAIISGFSRYIITISGPNNHSSVSNFNSPIHTLLQWPTIEKELLYFLRQIEKNAHIGMVAHNSFCVEIPNKSLRITLYQLTQHLETLPLATLHSVWRRVQKNSDGVVATKKSLFHLIHLLTLCYVKDNNRIASYPDLKDEPYLQYSKAIVSCLFDNFVSRNARQIQMTQQNYRSNNYVLSDLKCSSELIVGFEDLVENMPQWLFECDEKLQTK